MKRVSLLFVIAFLFLATGAWAQSGKVIGLGSTASCTATPQRMCTITLTWPNGGFNDTGYDAVCQVHITGKIDQGSSYPYWNLTQTDTTVTITGYSPSSTYGAVFSVTSCIAVHN
jgi:hypothetical protein